MLISFIEHFNYYVVIVLMMTGLYVVFASNNMIKKLVGLSVFQTSVFLLYITIGKVSGGIPPILPYPAEGDGHGEAAAHGVEAVHHGEAVAHGVEHAHGADHLGAGAHDVVSAGSDIIYSNPLPHVLILTAIVVGVATLSVGLALVVRVREVYGTIEEEEIDKINYAYNMEGVDVDEAQS